LAGKQGGQGHGRTGFNHNLQPRPDKFQRLQNVVLTDGGHIVDIPAHNGQIMLADIAHAQAVGDGVGNLIQGMDLPSRQERLASAAVSGSTPMTRQWGI
jgi:hypothetical protein